MSTASLFLLVAAVVLFAGLVKTAFSLIHAPEGFEDETGFHQFVAADGEAQDDRGFIRGLGNAKLM